MRDKHQWGRVFQVLYHTDLSSTVYSDLSVDRNCQFSKQVFNFTSHEKERQHILRGRQISYALGQKLYEGENCRHIYLYCGVGWGGVRTVRLLFPGYFLLLSVADRPPISTLVAQQDPRRPILEEFNFGNRLVTYASLKTKNMFCYRGYRKEESVSSTAEN